jgi:hypothetical protein
MTGLRHGEHSLDAHLILGDSAGILHISQQILGLLWGQGKQRAIPKHIPRPLLAAAHPVVRGGRPVQINGGGHHR